MNVLAKLTKEKRTVFELIHGNADPHPPINLRRPDYITIICG